MQSSTINIYSSRFPRPNYGPHDADKDTPESSLRFTRRLDKQGASGRKAFSTSPLTKKEPQNTFTFSSSDDEFEGDVIDDEVRKATTVVLSSRPGSRTVVDNVLGNTNSSNDDDEDSLARLVSEVAHNPLMRHPPKLPGI
jgi:hypothetical protein